ncbi:MAG: hypothetical protein WC965_01010 [Thiohalomonadaceae bacterium]
MTATYVRTLEKVPGRLIEQYRLSSPFGGEEHVLLYEVQRDGKCGTHVYPCDTLGIQHGYSTMLSAGEERGIVETLEYLGYDVIRPGWLAN